MHHIMFVRNCAFWETWQREQASGEKNNLMWHICLSPLLKMSQSVLVTACQDIWDLRASSNKTFWSQWRFTWYSGVTWNRWVMDMNTACSHACSHDAYMIEDFIVWTDWQSIQFTVTSKYRHLGQMGGHFLPPLLMINLRFYSSLELWLGWTKSNLTVWTEIVIHMLFLTSLLYWT